VSCSRSFVDHALDLLSGLGPVQARAMFGGYGLYVRGVMFGLLDDDELFFRTDEVGRARFAEAGCRMWTYGGMGETGYYRPPDAAHEDPESMEAWARLGLEAALRRKALKDQKARAAGARRAARERKARSGKKPAPARRTSPPGRRKR